MRILLLHNPDAGDGESSPKALTRLFEAHGHTVAYRKTKGRELDARDAEGADLIVVAGGDGTVGKAVRTFSSAGRCMAILALGTANNIARGLGIAQSAERIAEVCGHCEQCGLDAGIADGPWGRRVFLEGVGVGAIAGLVAAGDAAKMTFEEEKRFGIEAPGPFLRDAEPRHWRASVDGQALPDELLLVEILNMPVTGPGLPLGRGGWPGDRLLDVAFLRPENRDAFADWLDTDRSTPPAGLEVVRGERVVLEWWSGPLRIDDHFPDPPEAPAQVEVFLAAEQIRVLVPPEGDDA